MKNVFSASAASPESKAAGAEGFSHAAAFVASFGNANFFAIFRRQTNKRTFFHLNDPPVNSMKTYVLILLLSLGLTATAQPTLTKDETINYVNKKLKETVDHVYSNNNGKIGRVSGYYSVSITKTEKGIKIAYTFEDPFYTVSYEFNPAHIKDVLPYNNSTASAVNELSISLIGKTCAAKRRNGNESLAYANMLYLRADPSSLERIKKALMHLRDLYKAEDDPFGN